MKKLFLSLLVFVFLFQAHAQISHGGKPKSFQLQNLKSNIDYRVLPEIDVEALLAEDAEDEKYGDIPWRFGKDIAVDYNLLNSGTWETLENGDRLWRLEISSYGAYSLNLIFDDFFMPIGAQFFVYNDQRSHVIGSFNEQNNKPTGSFATIPVKGETSILEYFEPAEVAGQGRLSVSYVIHAYKNFLNFADKGFGSSGACNVNVNCPEGDEWRDQQRGVAMILNANNNRICSGSLVNNTAEDGTPYFLTANHCGTGSAADWIIMFNYESPSCEDIDGPTDQSIQYTTVRASNFISDLLLLELSEQPPLEYNVFYNGWNRSDENSDHSVAIHHPRGDIKKISFDNDPYTADKYLGNQSVEGSHWKIEQWDLGTTEGGSSGSPLFNPQKQIVGQLHGGYASCTSLTSDWYGKFSYSWDYYDEIDKQLKHWLDPANTGALYIDGYDVGGYYSYNAMVYGIMEPQTQYDSEAVFRPHIVLKNLGSVPLTSLNVSYQIDENTAITQQWSGNMATGDTAHVIFDELTLTFGAYEFTSFTDSPNGFEDQYRSNDTLRRNVSVEMDYDLAITDYLSPEGINCRLEDLKLEFYVKNLGLYEIPGIEVAVSLDGEDASVFMVDDTLAPNEEKLVSYAIDNEDTEWHSLDLEVFIQNHEDQNLSNNTYSAEFNAYGNTVNFNFKTDSYGKETSWKLMDENGEVLYFGDDYGDNEQHKESFCLTAGCYDFILYDAGGNGISYLDGYFNLSNINFDTVYAQNVEFEDSLYVPFCISNELSCDFAASSDSTCSYHDVYFYNKSVNADTYQWIFEGGFPVASNEINPVIHYRKGGVYDVKLNAWQGAEMITTLKEDFITVVECTGLEEVQNDLFKLYPNPTTGFITIELLDQIEFDQLIIYNALGKIVQQDHLNKSAVYQTELQLPKGLYFVELRSTQQSVQRVLMIN